MARAETAGRADLRLVGRLPAPTALGRIEFTSGQFQVNDRVFTVTIGEVDYIGPTRVNSVAPAVAETWDHRLARVPDMPHLPYGAASITSKSVSTLGSVNGVSTNAAGSGHSADGPDLRLYTKS